MSPKGVSTPRPGNRRPATIDATTGVDAVTPDRRPTPNEDPRGPPAHPFLRRKDRRTRWVKAVTTVTVSARPIPSPVSRSSLLTVTRALAPGQRMLVAP